MAGVLFMAWAVGGLAATVIVPAVACRTSDRSVAFAAMWFAAIGVVGCAVTMSVPVALAATVIWGFGYLSVMLVTVVWRQLSMPNRLRSRVNTAARMAAYGVGYPLGGAGIVIADVALLGFAMRRG